MNPSNRERERERAGHTSTVFEVDLDLTVLKGKREKLPHRCSQAAVRRISSLLNEDTTIAHILWFSKYTVHMKETHPSAFTGTSSLTRCQWLHWGQNSRKEEPILFFSTGLKLLMDALPKSMHPHTQAGTKWCDCMLMRLLVAMHYLLNRPKD